MNTNGELFHERLKSRMLLALAQAVTPQQVVETLVDYFYHDQLRLCSLWLCNSKRSAYHHTNADYIALGGLWGHGLRAGEGIGTRLYISNSNIPEMLRQVGGLTSDGSANLDDPLLKSLRKSYPTDHWLLFPLMAGKRHYGMVFLATENSTLLPQLAEHIEEIVPAVSVSVAHYVLHQEQVTNRYERAALINAVRDGILITQSRPQGNTVLMANERFRYLFNCYDNLDDTPLDDLLQQAHIPASVKQQLAAVWQRADHDRLEVERGEFEMVTHEGQSVDIAWYSAPMINPESDEVFARLFIFHDTTLERVAVQVRSAFMSRISHELRTPLTAISGFAESMMESGDLPHHAQEYVEIIHTSAQKLKHLFTELIEITRIEAGQVILSLKPTHLEDTVQAVVRRMEEDNIAHGQNIRVAVPDDLPPAFADAERTRKVIHALLHNATQYAPPDGEIDITLSKIERVPSAYAPRDMMLPAVLVSIRDNGDGVPTADVQQIFEPFYRGKNAYANQIEGTGLGLSLASSLIRLQRGSIWAQPATKQAPGGHFYFTFPIATTP